VALLDGGKGRLQLVAGTGRAAADIAQRPGQAPTLGVRNFRICGIFALMEMMFTGDAPMGSPSKRMRNAYLPYA
jgi:hypothetical protein